MENETKAVTLADWEKPQVLENRIKRMLEIQQSVMNKGIDYDIIPGCKKPSLLKPGGELLLRTFNLAATPSIEEIKEPNAVRYRIRMDIHTVETGVFLGSGVGEASTDEEKYKWRKAVCEEEYDDFPEESKRQKWFKADRYHSKPYKVLQVRTNPSDVANTVLKMAKKRALIDGTLTVLSASRIYAQDIEDMSKELQEMMKDDPGSKSSKPGDLKPTTEKKENTFETRTSESGNKRRVPTEEEISAGKLINEKQGNLILAKLKEHNVSEAAFLKCINKPSVYFVTWNKRFKHNINALLAVIEKQPEFFDKYDESKQTQAEEPETVDEIPTVSDQEIFINEAMDLARQSGLTTEAEINYMLKDVLKLPGVVNITNIRADQQSTVLEYLQHRIDNPEPKA